MRIVHIVLALNVGGIECMLLDICGRQALSAQVSLIIVNDSYDPRLLESMPADVSVVLIKRPSGSRNPWYLLRALRTVQRLNPDIVHLHQLSLISLLRMLPFPRITTVHSTLPDDQTPLPAAKHLCGISEAVGQTIRRAFPHARCAIVPNGVDFSRIEARSKRHEGPHRLVQVSRLHHSQKGQDVVLHALRALRQRRTEHSLSVTFVGGGTSRDYLETLARELGVSEQCIFLGEKPREWVYQHLCDYDLLLQPSRHEGFGLTIVEAMAARVPVLVSDLAAPMEVIAGGQFGYHFESGNSLDCAACIQQALSDLGTPPAQARVAAAYDHARKHFDVSRTVDRYFEEYEAAMESQGSRSRNRCGAAGK